MVDQEYKQQENLHNKIQKILGVKECEEIHKILEGVKEELGQDMETIIALLGQAAAKKLEKDTEKLIRFIVSSLKVDKKYLLKPKLKKALLKYTASIRDIEEFKSKNKTINKIKEFGADIMHMIDRQEQAIGKGQEHLKIR